MRILHCTLSFAPGGRRRAIATLGERLRALDTPSDLCCLDQLACDPAEIAGVFEVVTALKRRSVWDIAAVRRLLTLCDTHGTTIIHAHDAASQFTATLVRLWRPRIKVVMTFHRTLGFESAYFRDRARNAWACALSGAVVCGSRERRRHFLAENFVAERKVIRIPFGIDVERFRPDQEGRTSVRQQLGLAPRTIVFGAVGHFGPVKGIDQIIRGFAALGDRMLPCPVALVVLGDGTPAQQDALRALARHQQTGPVLFAGHRSDVQRWFQAMDVYVHTPRAEAFGLAVAEAMAAGLPIVATSVGGIADLVRPGQNGFLVPVREPQHLADALACLVLDPSLREALGEASYRIAREEYSADLYAQRHLRLYQDLLTNRLPQGIAPDYYLADETKLPSDRMLPVLATRT